MVSLDDEEPKKPKKVFHFSLSADVDLEIDQIWPDGDAPENPTVDDVLKVIAACGGAHEILRDWDLDQDLDLTISDEKESKHVP